VSSTVGLNFQFGTAAEGLGIKSCPCYQIPSFTLAQFEPAMKILEWAFGPFFVSREFVLGADLNAVI